jgi:pyrimidine-nucleoside phosphorylase
MNSSNAATFLDQVATGKALSEEEISAFISGATRGTVDRAQVAAFMMAVACRGLPRSGLHALTLAYVRSGRALPRSGGRPIADKHSTGGVGDKLTFLVCPLVAAAGGAVRKMSGKSLRHCSGTIDKLSALAGFRHETSVEAFLAEVEEFGFSIIPQSDELCPADAITYSIRDACGATGSLDLIAASIMSKKIASGADGLVLDVKLGPGGLLRSERQAIDLGAAMLDLAKMAGIHARVYLTDMTRPLGRAIGTSSEVGEALYVLGGRGDAELAELAVEIATAMLFVSEGGDEHACRSRITAALRDGSARRLFGAWLTARGADPQSVEESFSMGDGVPVYCRASGWIAALAPERLGRLAASLHSSPGTRGNVVLCKSVGDRVEAGEIIARLDDGTPNFGGVTARQVVDAWEAVTVAEQDAPLKARVVRILGDPKRTPEQRNDP